MMDGTIPIAIGQWLLDSATTLLAYPGPYGWGIITMASAPPAIRWLATLPLIRKHKKR